MCSVCVLPVFACVCLCFLSVKKPSNNKRGSSIEAPGAGSVAWVAKGNKIIFGLVYLCPSAASCVRERLVRPTTRELQELHVVPDVPHQMCSMLLCPTSRCICCLILERATCGLEAKKVQYSSARFHAAISRIDSPSFEISPNIPTLFWKLVRTSSDRPHDQGR